MQDPHAFEQLMQMMMAQGGMRQWCKKGDENKNVNFFVLFMLMNKELL